MSPLGDGKSASVASPAAPPASSPSSTPPPTLDQVEVQAKTAYDDVKGLYESAKQIFGVLAGEPKHALLEQVYVGFKAALASFEANAQLQDVHGIAPPPPKPAPVSGNFTEGTAGAGA